MKLLKTLTLGLMAAAVAGTASAAPIASNPTIIHVVGSTAFRVATTIAILDALHGNTAAAPTGGTTAVYGAFAGTNLSSASYQIFANGTTSGSSPTATIVVETFWTGSLAGCVDLTAQTSAATFPDDTDTSVQSAIDATPIDFAGGYIVDNTSDAGYNYGFSATAHVHSSSTIEMAMSDSYKGTIGKELANANFISGGVGSFATPTALSNGVSGNTYITDAGTSNYATGATPNCVSIVPFEWVVGNLTANNTYSDSSTLVIPTNITTQVARQLVTSGYIPQALFTGTNTVADSSDWFFFIGRNEDSGTRIGYLQESQFGVTGNPVQWAINGSAYNNGSPTSITVNGTQEFPINDALNTEPNIVWKNHLGHSGYASGGNVATYLSASANIGGTTTWASNAQPSDVGFDINGNPVPYSVYFISSLGLTDAATVLNSTNKGHLLTFNGVSYSPANIQNGTYSDWEFEHCYRLVSEGDSTAIGGFVDKVADLIFAVDADSVYNPSSVTGDQGAKVGLFKAEQSNGSYDLTYGATPGVKYDGFVTVTRSTTEGGPISPQY